jgi:hypothetical protein
VSSYLSCAVPATPVPDAGAWRAGDLVAGCPAWVIAAGAGDLADPSGGRQELCDAAAAAGLVKPGERRRLMSLPFIMRVVIAMTLLPDAGYPEVIRALAGVLPRLPWAKRWQVPTRKAVTGWRRRLGRGR